MQYPDKQGLYDPALEHDSCGVGFIVDMHNRSSHEIVQQGLQLIGNLEHRGALGADPKTGDGCGVMIQIPHEFFAQESPSFGIRLPDPGEYGIGTLFLPQNQDHRFHCGSVVESTIIDSGLELLGWRDFKVPIRSCRSTERVRSIAR